MNNIRLLLFSLIAVTSLAACSTTTPHQNFKSHMTQNVGLNIDDPKVLWRRSDLLLNRHSLQNGHIEEAYRFRGTCQYFFEVDPATKTIVSWRFEGTEQDCEIVP